MRELPRVHSLERHAYLPVLLQRKMQSKEIEIQLFIVQKLL